MVPPSLGGGGVQSGLKLKSSSLMLTRVKSKLTENGLNPIVDEDLDVQRELSPDVEQADRVVGHGRAELEQPELAVVVGVVPVEAHGQLDAADHADLEDADRDRRARLEVAGELHDRDRACRCCRPS